MHVLLLKVLLKNLNYQIATANDGLQALSAVETEKPDLILLDVMMPGLNGFEVAEKLKENPETRDIPIIFLTALNATSDVVRGFKAGANDFISKPFHKEELLIRVSHQISLIAARRIIIRQTEELQRTISGRDKLYSVHHARPALADRFDQNGSEHAAAEPSGFVDRKGYARNAEHGQPHDRRGLLVAGQPAEMDEKPDRTGISSRC